VHLQLDISANAPYNKSGQHILLIQILLLNVDGTSQNRPKKRWVDCVKDDMRIKGVSMEMTNDTRE
jgi:hypothetical protein